MKKLGDRRDAKRVKGLDGVHQLIPYIKPKRCDSDVYMNKKTDATELVKYMEKLKKKYPDKKITYFHLFSMAIAKVFYNKPLLNRFVINKNYYDHNDVKLAFVAKVAFDKESKEMLTTIKVNKDTDLFKLADIISKKVSNIRSNKNSDTDKAVEIVGKLPKFLRTIIMAVFKFMDNHDLLPSSLTENDIYHSSIILSNLGSIDCGSIYHNLTDFGTSSILLTMGKIHKEPIVNEKGEIEIKDLCDFGINLDERIADGLYFAKSINLFEYILQNPKLLEGRADEPINFDSKK